MAIDPATGGEARLFHPLLEQWREHFRFGGFNGYEIEGLTPQGRATVDALKLNQSRRLLIRHAEEIFGLFPPA